MASKPLVSVIVIFLNEEQFLTEAVESVLAQTYPHWELMLVDDGSSDQSTEIAQQFVEKDSRIRYVTHPDGANRGMSASRNRGVAVSRGELVAFLDADDVWLPEKLEEQVELLERYPEAAMVYGRTQWWFSWDAEEEEVSARDYLFDPGVPLDSIVEPPTLLPPLIRNDGNPPYTCSMLVRRPVYDRLGGFEEAFPGLFEDQAFFAKVFLEERIYVSARCWDRYRQHDQSACSVGLRTGELHPLDLSPARHAFLEWLDGHFESKRVSDQELRSLLAAELEPYRFPAATAIVESVDVQAGAPELAGFALDFPQPGTLAAGRRIHVMGWAIGKSSNVEEIELRAGDRVVSRALVTQRRPDLETVFAEHGEALTAGFRTSVSFTGMAPLEVEMVAVLEGGDRVKLGSFRAVRCFREQDSELGFPLVSVVIPGSGAELLDAIEGVRAQTYPCFEVVVVAEDQATEELARAIPSVRVAPGPLGDWEAAGLRAARGSLIVLMSASDRLRPDSLEAGLAALTSSLGSGRAGGLALEAGEVTIHHRFALASGAAERLPAIRHGFDGTRPQSNGGGLSTTVILMYHRVADLGADPWGLAVGSERFAEQLELLASRYEVVPLARCLEAASNGPRVVITFDDGYADNLLAARLLAAKGLPATFFLAAGQLGADREFWWDDLERILLGTKPDSWRATDEPKTLRHRAYIDRYGRLKGLEQAERERVLDELAQQADMTRAVRPAMRSLSCEEVVELASIDRMEIGAHTLTHPRLSSLPLARQRDEIVGSRHRLEEIAGRPIESFAYPHGTRADYTPETVGLVAEAGFRRACIAEGGALESLTPPLELPRLMVEDWRADELERRLALVFAAAPAGVA